MTNKEFIEKAFYGKTHKNSHNSLMKDGENNVYSYGYHYPLLFTASDNDAIVFINTTGYSNTTAKHINHAWSAVDYKAIGIKLNGKRLHPSFTMNDALETLQKEYVEISDKMQSKKRKNTQVYRILERNEERLAASIDTVKKAMRGMDLN